MTTARLLLLLQLLLLLLLSSSSRLVLAEQQQQQQHQQRQQQQEEEEEVTLATPLRHQQNQRPSFIERKLREHEAQQGAAVAATSVQDQQQQQTTLGIRHGRSRGRNHGRHIELEAALPTEDDELLMLQPMFYQPSELWNTSGAVYELAEQDLYVENSSVTIQQQEQQSIPGIVSAAGSSSSGAGGGKVDIVTRFLRIIENQHLLGENCTAGTDLNLGEGVVDQYAQERFRLEANLAVNRANMLTRLWKYAPEVMSGSEYLLHASVLSMVEFDEDIFAAGNCYDKLQYRERWLYCPFAHRLQDEEGVLVKDLAVEYKYLSNSSEWFYIARKNAERRIASYNQFSRGKLPCIYIYIYAYTDLYTYSYMYITRARRGGGGIDVCSVCALMCVTREGEKESSLKPRIDESVSAITFFFFAHPRASFSLKCALNSPYSLSLSAFNLALSLSHSSGLLNFPARPLLLVVMRRSSPSLCPL